MVVLALFLTNTLIGQTIHASQGSNCVEYTLKSDNTMVGKQYSNGTITKYINGTWSQSSYQRGYETTVTISASGYSVRLSAYYTAFGSLEQFIDAQGRRWSMGTCDGSSSNASSQSGSSYQSRSESSKYFDVDDFIQYRLGSLSILVSKYPWRYVDVQAAMRQKQVVVNNNDAYYIPSSGELSAIKKRIKLPEDMSSRDYYIWSRDQYPPGSGEIVVVNFASNSNEKKTAGSEETSKLGVRPIFVSRRNTSMEVAKSLKPFKDDLYYSPVLESYTKEDITKLLSKLGSSYRLATKDEIETLQLWNYIGSEHQLGEPYMFRHIYAPRLSLDDPDAVRYEYFYYDFVIIKTITPEEKAAIAQQAEERRKREEEAAARNRFPRGDFRTFNVFMVKEFAEISNALSNASERNDFRDSLLDARNQIFKSYARVTGLSWLFINNRLYMGTFSEDRDDINLKWLNKNLSDEGLPKLKLSDFTESIYMISWTDNLCYCSDLRRNTIGLGGLFGPDCIEIIVSKEEYDTLKSIYNIEKSTANGGISKESKFFYCN